MEQKRHVGGTSRPDTWSAASSGEAAEPSEAGDIKLRDPKVAALAHMPGFGGYRDSDLAPLAAEMEERSVAAGTVLLDTGGRVEELLLVVAGKAAVLVEDAEVGVVLPGEFIGEMSLLERTDPSGTVQALTAMRVLALPATRFARLLQEAAVARALARTLSERLRRAQQALADSRQGKMAPGSVE